MGAGTPLAAEIDYNAALVRGLERALVGLKEAVPEFRGEALLAFVNRLSDYLFILARTVEGGQHQTVDYSALDA